MEELSLERKNNAFTFESNSTVMIETGVYLLYRGDQVVYVGGSEDIYKSIATCKNKSFDSWNYLSCTKEILNGLTEGYILYYKPILNTTIRTYALWISKAKAKKEFGISKSYFNKLIKENYFEEIMYFKDIYVLTQDIQRLDIDMHCKRDEDEYILDIEEDDDPLFTDAVYTCR